LEKEKVVGILGGMGPFATADFFRLIIAGIASGDDSDFSEMNISPKSRIIIKQYEFMDFFLK